MSVNHQNMKFWF